VVGLSLLSKFVMSSTCLHFAEGKGSLHSFLKARGLATSLSAGVGDEGMHRSSLAYIFGMSIHLTDYGLEKVLSLSCLVYLEDFYFSALRCYSPHFLEDLEELLLMWSMSTCLDHNILVIQALQELFEFIARVFFYEENHALSAVVTDYNDLYLQIFDIIGFVYQYLKLLREVPPQQWIFKELQDIGNMEFRFAEEQPQDDYAAELAGLSLLSLAGIYLFVVCKTGTSSTCNL